MTRPIRSMALAAAESMTNARLFDSFHDFIRRFYLTTFTPWLARKYGGIRLEPRNSFRSGFEFNVFRSDLDLALIIDDGDFSVLQLLERERKIFPFIGEIEIYTSAEWELRERLLLRPDARAELIATIRKISWQKSALANANSHYHKRKAHNSINRALRAAGVRDLRELSSLLEKSFAGERSLSAPIESAESNFLGCTLGSDLKSSLGLCAVLPDGTVLFEDLEHEVARLRQRPGICDSYVHILLREWLLCRSVERVGGGPRIRSWILRLETDIAIAASWENLAAETRELIEIHFAVRSDRNPPNGRDHQYEVSKKTSP